MAFMSFLVYSFAKVVLEAKADPLHGKNIGRKMLITGQTFYLWKCAMPMFLPRCWFYNIERQDEDLQDESSLAVSLRLEYKPEEMRSNLIHCSLFLFICSLPQWAVIITLVKKLLYPPILPPLTRTDSSEYTWYFPEYQGKSFSLNREHFYCRSEVYFSRSTRIWSCEEHNRDSQRSLWSCLCTISFDFGNASGTPGQTKFKQD